MKRVALLALHRFSCEQQFPNIDILLVSMVNKLRKYPHTIYILSVSFNENEINIVKAYLNQEYHTKPIFLNIIFAPDILKWPTILEFSL